MKVFISYTQSDQRLASDLAHDLSLHGFVASLPNEFLKPGDSFADVITKQIVTSEAVILLISDAYAKSQSTSMELSLAVYQQSKSHSLIIPVVTSQHAEIPPIVDRFLYLRAFDRPCSEVLQAILLSLSRIVKKASFEDSNRDWSSIGERADALYYEKELEAIAKMKKEVSLATLIGILSVTVSAISAFLSEIILFRTHKWWTWTLAIAFVGLLAFIGGFELKDARLRSKRIARLHGNKGDAL